MQLTCAKVLDGDVAVVMFETESQKLAKDNALSVEDTMELDKFIDDRLDMDSSEQFDLYEWALEFSTAVGFEFEKVA